MFIIVEVIIFVLLFATLLTQVILPLLQGRTVFPFLSRRREQQAELRRIRTEAEERAIDAHIEELRKQLTKENIE